MIHLAYHNRKPFVLSLVITLIVMLMMSYFGFRLKGFRPHNQVSRSVSGNSLVFGRYATAYTEQFFSSDERSLSIEIAVIPTAVKTSGFRTLLLVHGGRDDQQLVIGQWRSTLIIMNGDDYAHKRKIPRISIPLDKESQKAQLVTVTSGMSGTVVYLDGKRIKQKKKLVLKYPVDSQRTRLVVGNNLSRGQQWRGVISGISLYDRVLSEKIVQKHHQDWSQEHNFSAFKPDAPRLLYAFEGGEAHRVKNLMENGIDLMVPARVNILQLKILTWPDLEGSIRSLMKDIFINFFGFIPLGFLVAVTVIRLEGVGLRSTWAFVVGVSFCFSLSIEVFQAWMPSRSSSALDLLLNSLGGSFGGVLFWFYHTRINKKGSLLSRS